MHVVNVGNGLYTITNIITKKKVGGVKENNLKPLLLRFAKESNAIKRELEIAKRKGYQIAAKNLCLMRISTKTVIRGGKEKQVGVFESFTCTGDGMAYLTHADKTVKIENIPGKPKSTKIKPTKSATVKIVKSKKTSAKKEVAATKRKSVSGSQIQARQDSRTSRARKTDTKRKAKHVVDEDEYWKWIKHPNRYDIVGIDTP